ncbi:MAG: DNA-directed DNA polymerase II small subunit [Candidatus Methanospirareceae archaeon]
MSSGRNGKEKELELVKRFADLGFQIHPEAIELLARYNGNGEGTRDLDPDEIAESVSRSLDPSICVISPEHIAEFIKEKGAGDDEREEKAVRQQTHEEAPTILKSFPEHGKSADHKDFLPHFIDRYERISGIIKKRVKCRQIRSLKSGMGGEDISVVGMVSSINKTAKGNLRVELEDPTGSLSVIVPHQEEIIPDEVIGVTGFLANEGYFIGNKVIHPDVPISASTSQSSLSEEESVYGVFISDLHVGSKTFLEEVWGNFVEWLKETERISYLVVAGDIADGIGVYPSQEDDLLITDIEEQYKVAARYFHDLPSRIHVVIAPGNHDAVRGAEPQPPLPDDLRKFFPDTTCFVSNPAYIRIGGRQVLIYHGQSYDDLVNSVSRLSYSKPEDVMIEMLRRRHLAPIYGNTVSILPDEHDYGVIDPVPDILHSGHTHTMGIAKYRNVLLINSGTWQSQTPYQKKRGITPVAGCATVVELCTLKVKVMDFGSKAGA